MAPKYFWAKDFSAAATRHGVDCESLAREMYAAHRKVKVFEIGLITSQDNPWISYSPDGVVLRYHIPSILLKIKSPVYLETVSNANLLRTCKRYLYSVNGKIELRDTHQYYSQVQLGMAVLNVYTCDFVMIIEQINIYFIKKNVLHRIYFSDYII